MFDLGWDEMLVIGVVALIVLGPKELPNALRTVSTVMKNARKLAGEFQSGVNEIIREADLEEARKKLNEVQSLNKNQIQNAVEKAIDPTGEVKSALKAEVDPTGPARIEANPDSAPPAAQDSLGTVHDTEDHAVEIAAAQPSPSLADPTLPLSPVVAADDPDVTPAPEPVRVEPATTEKS